MYRLTYSDLVNAGVPVADLAPQHLHLTSGYPAVEVASEITGASDGRFDPTDEIRFYGAGTRQQVWRHEYVLAGLR